ncbi:MAG: bifunctional folylpolyglutamate synthase/dihydrofolate synthase [Nitrospirae bacterium]|nr:bifunctional folylpolyglutamate synthase/dihydrofolate synthase [Nitrospirota bacterium]
MTYPETLQYLFQLQKRGIKPGLSAMVDLLADVGNPHHSFETIHVGGTNGKGSACAFLSSCLRSSGYKAGLYTSPHLVDFTERIVVNSVPISQSDVVRLAGLIRNSISHPVTFFEFTTALAFLYFMEQEVDIAVIEVGLGGRLDSTNVISPLAVIITHIDFDHQEFLGNTLLEIAGEKAGIIKKNIPVISGVSHVELRELIFKTAGSLEAPLFQMGADFASEPVDAPFRSNAFHYRGMDAHYRNLSTPLLGEHQAGNASLAIAALEVIRKKGFFSGEKSIRAGLLNVHWPGRIEVIQENPLIILDGAHNPSGARTLSGFLHRIEAPGRRFLVLGIMKDKDIEAIGQTLFPWADEIILTQAGFQRAASPRELLAALPPVDKPVYLIDSIPEALEFLKAKSCSNDAVCFTGSLYTVGEAKAALEGIKIPVPLHG